jgi:hypothetical protein
MTSVFDLSYAARQNQLDAGPSSRSGRNDLLPPVSDRRPAALADIAGGGMERQISPGIDLDLFRSISRRDHEDRLRTEQVILNSRCRQVRRQLQDTFR